MRRHVITPYNKMPLAEVSGYKNRLKWSNRFDVFHDKDLQILKIFNVKVEGLQSPFNSVSRYRSSVNLLDEI